MTLLGASLVFAGGELGREPAGSESPGGTLAVGANPSSSARRTTRSPVPEPTATPTPQTGPPGPTLAGGEQVYIRTRTFDLRGALPEGITQRNRKRIGIYVDGKLVRQVRLPAGVTFTVKAIPLRLGRHRITATVRGVGPETRHSTPITVVVDQSPPRLALVKPLEGQLINADRATIQGTLVGGFEVGIVNETTAAIATASPNEEGAFSAEIPMAAGVNEFVITGRDRAGNTAETRVRVMRGEDRTSAGLRMSAERIRISRLPASIWVEAQVRDADRRPITDAEVTFTLSPPGLPTTTYRATTDQLGFARWENVSLPREGAQPGKGFATVHVVLPGGGTLQETVPFTFL